ncbi:MAG: hypothetical protein LBJ39_06665 [Tannerellaceae bacterium]|nr:hypothetical protein [Tannerellaceae bacterium]
MKVNFKYATWVAVVLLLGLGSCSNDDGNENGSESDGTLKTVKVRISRLPSTYSEGTGTAVGVTPKTNGIGATLFFIGNGVVKAIETIPATPGNDIASFSDDYEIPGTVDKLVIIANSSLATDPALSTIAVNDSETELNQLKFQQSNQTDPLTGVNLYGTGSLSSGAFNVTVAPIAARIEIGKVEAKTGAAISLTSFKLTGIYINNTYTKLGVDRTTKPTLPAEILNYGTVSTSWTDNSYPVNFKNEYSSVVNGTSFTPSGLNNLWYYFVIPAKANHGTIIDGKQQTSVPHIVLKIEDATASGYTFAAVSYVTIKQWKTAGDVLLTEFDPGKVYSIASIAIGGENLSDKPEDGDKITVDVVISSGSGSSWTDSNTTPSIP